MRGVRRIEKHDVAGCNSTLEESQRLRGDHVDHIRAEAFYLPSQKFGDHAILVDSYYTCRPARCRFEGKSACAREKIKAARPG